MPTTDRPRLLLAWENLSPGAQIAIALPALLVVLWVLHVALFAQPVGRGLGYAVFWGVLGTVALVAASRAERARREARERARAARRPR